MRTAATPHSTLTLRKIDASQAHSWCRLARAASLMRHSPVLCPSFPLHPSKCSCCYCSTINCSNFDKSVCRRWKTESFWNTLGDAAIDPASATSEEVSVLELERSGKKLCDSELFRRLSKGTILDFDHGILKLIMSDKCAVRLFSVVGAEHSNSRWSFSSIDSNRFDLEIE